VSWLRVLISMFFADLDIIIQELSSFWYHKNSCCSSSEIHFDLSVVHTFLDLEQFDQTHQVSSFFSFLNYCRLQLFQTQVFNDSDLDKFFKTLSHCSKQTWLTWMINCSWCNQYDAENAESEQQHRAELCLFWHNICQKHLIFSEFKHKNLYHQHVSFIMSVCNF